MGRPTTDTEVNTMVQVVVEDHPAGLYPKDTEVLRQELKRRAAIAPEIAPDYTVNYFVNDDGRVLVRYTLEEEARWQQDRALRQVLVHLDPAAQEARLRQ